MRLFPCSTLLACLLFAADPSAMASGIFTAFKGNYTGTSTLSGTTGATISGQATGTFVTANGGSTGTLKLQALYVYNGVGQYIGETFSFAREGKVITIDAI